VKFHAATYEHPAQPARAETAFAAFQRGILSYPRGMLLLPLFQERRIAVMASLCLAPIAMPAVLRAQATMVHTLEAFHAPAAVLALPGGHTLLVSNTGRGEYGLIAGRGSISRLTLGDDGHLTVDKLRFIEDLNGPVGLTLLATGSDALPAGTLVVSVGGSWMVDSAGKSVPDDATRGTGLAFFDLPSGRPLGRALLGRGSATEKLLGYPITDPTGIASDPAGNIYITDAASMAARAGRRSEARVGITKISRAALDVLLKDEVPPAGSLQFAAENSIATTVFYSTKSDAVIWGTFAGEMREVPGGDLSGRVAVQTLGKQLGSLACLNETAKGTVVGVAAEGSLLVVRHGKARVLHFRKAFQFLSPGQFALVPGSNGRVLMILPEQGGGGVGPWRQRVNVIELPGDL
jgi:hypothetical protein